MFEWLKGFRILIPEALHPNDSDCFEAVNYGGKQVSNRYQWTWLCAFLLSFWSSHAVYMYFNEHVDPFRILAAQLRVGLVTSCTVLCKTKQKSQKFFSGGTWTKKVAPVHLKATLWHCHVLLFLSHFGLDKKKVVTLTTKNHSQMGSRDETEIAVSSWRWRNWQCSKTREESICTSRKVGVKIFYEKERNSRNKTFSTNLQRCSCFCIVAKGYNVNCPTKRYSLHHLVSTRGENNQATNPQAWPI